MQKKTEVVLRACSKQKKFIVISPVGISQVKEASKTRKKVFGFDASITLSIVKTQVLDKRHKFILRASTGTQGVQFLVEQQEVLQNVFRIIGRYGFIEGLQQILTSFKKVGQGAFAQVYEGVTVLERKMALKSFEKKNFGKVEKSRASFDNEITILKMLSSPHIVCFDYLFQTDKAFYLKMQFLEKTLKDKMAGKMFIGQQKAYMRQLLLALSEMKCKNIIHRDLKPENVMIRKNTQGQDECVIIDFGLATVADAKEYIFFRCGTPGFLAPQIANLTNKKEKQTCGSDMFSLGCIFFKMITGKYLFAGKTHEQILRNNRKCIYDTTMLSKLSVNEKRLFLRLIDYSPASRIQPEQALNEPYFNDDVDDCDEIAEEQCCLAKHLIKIKQTNQIKSMEGLRQSSLSFSLYENSNTSEIYRNVRNQSIKDSCLTFELGNLQESTLELKQIKRSSKSKGSRTPDKIRQSRFSTRQRSSGREV